MLKAFSSFCRFSSEGSINWRQFLRKSRGPNGHKLDWLHVTFPQIWTLNSYTNIQPLEQIKCAVWGQFLRLTFNNTNHNYILGKTLQGYLCGQTSTKTGTLIRHELIHSGEKANVCKYCGKSYTQAGDLKIHELIHTKKRQHVCNSCGQTSTETGTLIRHELIHRGEKVHVCKYCGKS